MRAKRSKTKEVVLIDPQELLALENEVAKCCGMSRATMMALTVLLHDIGMHRIDARHLTAAFDLAFHARHMLHILEGALSRVMAPSKPKLRKARRK